MKIEKDPLRKISSEEPGKLPLAKCKEILNKNGLNYSDDEILKIRDFLYKLAEIGVEEFDKETKEAKIISLNDQVTSYEESNYLRAG